MHYNLNWLLEQTSQHKPLDFLLFWGHRPRKDGQISSSCFSQWWIAPFEVEGIRYRTAEHWMMAGKAKLFNDAEMLQAILNEPEPAKVKKYGRKVKDFDVKTWSDHSYELVKAGNYHKFSQHDRLKDFLLNTGDKVIVEASPYDKIWGIGMDRNHPDAQTPERWQGMNLLGFALMEVRDSLR